MDAIASIPIRQAAACMDCGVLFDMKGGRCPKCASELSWYVVVLGATSASAHRVDEGASTEGEAKGAAD